MQAHGVRYQSAGENIGWVDNEPDGGSAASYINGQFMNSPDHRANILNGNYNTMGAGSAFSSSWACGGCGGGPFPSAWMFSEEFAQLGSSPPPPPSPTPRPAPRPVSSTPARNSPAPPPPAQPPVTTAPTAAPPAAPTPAPTPTPFPVALLPGNVPAPPIYQYPGLLPSSVESVLEAFLLD